MRSIPYCLIAVVLAASIPAGADPLPQRAGGGSESAPRAEGASGPSQPELGAGRTQDSEEDRKRPLVITVRELEPATVVYTEYDGPYWGIGPVLSRVRADMSKAGRNGATFVRYADDPRERTLTSERTQVGYFAEPGVNADGMYVVGHWQSHEVVTTTVLGPNTGTTSLYPELRQWARDHGYEVIGPITEVYYPTKAGDSVEHQQTEIRMPVKAAKAPTPALNSTSAPSDRRVRADDSETRAVTVAPLGTTDIERPGAAGSQAREDAAADPVEETETAIGKQETTQVEHSFPETADLAQLLERGEYERAMGALFATFDNSKSALSAWLGQVADRIQAIADGLDQMGKSSGEVVRIAAAFDASYEEWRAHGSTPGRGSGVDRTGTEGGAGPPARSEVLRRLDRLMARIAMRAADEDACVEELRSVLESLAVFATEK